MSTSKRQQCTSSNSRRTPKRTSTHIRSITPSSILKFSSEDHREITAVKELLRNYHQTLNGKCDASIYNKCQIVHLKKYPCRFNYLDFLFCLDAFICNEIIYMRANRKESLLTKEKIPLLAKSSYAALREYRDMR